jgi:hypothetical protein
MTDIQFGDIWQVGPHIVACGDIEQGHALELVTQERPMLCVSDPPWGAGPATSYRTKAAMPRKVDFEHFLHDFFTAVTKVVGPICIEIGSAQVGQVVRVAVEHGLFHADTQPMYYYRTKPCSCLFFTHTCVAELVDPMPCADEMIVYRWLIDQFSSIGETVFDPCVGKGMIAEAAHALGRHVLGLELHPRRLAVTLDRLTRAGIPRKIGVLHV